MKIPGELTRFLYLSTDSAFMADDKGRFVLCNPPFCDALGKSQAELIDRRVIDIAAEPHEKIEGAFRRCLRSGSPIVGAFSLRKSDEETVRFPYRGMVVRRRSDDTPALLAFQLERSIAFRVLDEQIRRLDAEVRTRREKERELVEAFERFRMVMDSLDALVYVADMETYEVLFVNEYGKRTFGEIKGKLCWQTLQSGQSGPCDFCTNDRLLDADGKPTGVYHWEFRNTVNREWYDCRDQAIPWTDGRFVRLEIATNITERKRAEEELQAAHRQLENIIEFLPDATFVVDRQKKVIAWNRAIEEMTGVPKGEMLGRGECAYGRPFYGARRPLLIDLLDRPAPEIEAKYDFVGRRGDALIAEIFLPSLRGGKGANLWAIASPLLDQDGKQVGAIESLRDITEKKEAEGKLKEANRELDAFVYTVSHDLRTPLCVILGYADFIREAYRDRLEQQALDGLAEISVSGEKMLKLMEDLLALAKVGQIERPDEPVDTKAVAEEVIRDLAEPFSEAGTGVEIGDLPSLRVPKTLLLQVFDNLLVNAMRYGSQGGGIIEVGGERRGARVRLYVRDHGRGIPAEERRRIFDPFYRGTTGKDLKGTGLGLATVQKVAHLFDGKAWVEETPGGGSTFWIELVDASGSREK